MPVGPLHEREFDLGEGLERAVPVDDPVLNKPMIDSAGALS